MDEPDTDAALSRLKDLCPPPSHPEVPPVPGTASIVPAGHRALTGAYGAGCFDEFLWIFAEGASNGHLDIAEQTERMRSHLRGRAVPGLGPVLDGYGAESGDLIQWGITDNADLLGWIPVGDPAHWPTVIIQAGRLGAVVTVDSSTDTVFRLLTRALKVPFFPDDFPSERPSFSPNPYG
ncbi:hypothetical protein [Streptomyces sp. CC219B]|uniref:hypothetical protein n=1 Tax=Streptomyces sp. CC219B TaxID=3044574 RepID=UPI0024A8200F|nr:hypothetical protein [Streptomyces sp. CC219B]